MKHILLISCLAVCSCTTATTYHADGSKTVVKSVDPNAWVLGSKALDTVAVSSK